MSNFERALQLLRDAEYFYSITTGIKKEFWRMEIIYTREMIQRLFKV